MTCSGRPPVAAAAPSDPVTAKFNIARIYTLTKFFTGLITEAYAIISYSHGILSDQFMVKKQAVWVHKSHMNKTRVLFKLFSNTEHLNYFKLHAKKQKQKKHTPPKNLCTEHHYRYRQL